MGAPSRLHPWVERDGAWLYEGLASYYQQVARGRSGVFSPAETWAALERGFERGRRSGTGRTLREESRRMRETHSFRRVYWAGAAVAFRWDVELLRRTDGRRDLGAALRDLARDLPLRRRVHTVDEVLDALDARLERPLFRPVAEQALASAEFPEVDDLFAAVGQEEPSALGRRLLRPASTEKK